jgi:hypothetical protein
MIGTPAQWAYSAYSAFSALYSETGDPQPQSSIGTNPQVGILALAGSRRPDRCPSILWSASQMEYVDEPAAESRGLISLISLISLFFLAKHPEAQTKMRD